MIKLQSNLPAIPIDRHTSSLRHKALFALILIVPASSIGALVSLFLAPGIVGQVVLVGCGIWMLVFPIAWTFFVDRRLLNLTTLKLKGMLSGFILGLLMFGIILGLYWFWGKPLLNPAEIRAKAQHMGLSGSTSFLLVGLYFTLINSLLEEYVWRWFVYRKCEVIVSKHSAVWLSALFFTLHHVLGLLAYTHNWRVIVVGTLAVFLAGVLWSRYYQVYRSLLPSYISHVGADLALHIVAWNILFG